MRLIIKLFTVLFVLFSTTATAQKVALKSNLLYDATSTINLGLEVSLSRNLTLELSGNYNPWTFSDNKKIKHILVQPELRWWTCQKFNGHFFGVHTLYANYNVGGMLPWDIKPDFIKSYRYEGWGIGAGVSYGYHWILSNRWSIEASVGLGYVYTKYDKYWCRNCGRLKNEDITKQYVGPTKLGISLIYFLK